MNSVAAQQGLPLFTADVSQAFLRDLTFEKTANMNIEVQRDVQVTVLPGSTHLLQRLPGVGDFDPSTEVLRTLRCGLGLKDAQRPYVAQRHSHSIGPNSYLCSHSLDPNS